MALQLLQGLPSHELSLAKAFLNLLLRRDFLCFLPSELAIHILCFLDEKSLATCCLVSKQWRKLCWDNQLWKKVSI